MELSTLEKLSKEAEKHRFWRRAGWAWGLILLSVFVGDRVLNGARGAKQHQESLQEFQQLRSLPNATVVSTSDSYSSWNSHRALVGATYRTELPYGEIANFYDSELRSHGWKLASEKPMKDWGKDLGGSELTYCKGAFAATLQFAGTQANYGWTYAFDLTWGLNDCR